MGADMIEKPKGNLWASMGGVVYIGSIKVLEFREITPEYWRLVEAAYNRDGDMGKSQEMKINE
jgi:hypothetical protein